jgi:hypothetical protein
MIFRLAADAVLVVHLAFILFVVAGGWLVVRYPRLIWFHVPAAGWGAFVELAGWVCPLTPLENDLRIAAGSAGSTGGFIERYLAPVIYPAGLDRPFQVALGLVVVVVNGIAYRRVFARWARSSRDD